MNRIQFGFTANDLRPLEEEVAFAKANGFSFLQIWFDSNGLLLGDKSTKEKLDAIEKIDFPFVLHKLMDVTISENALSEYIGVYKRRHWDGVILHPVVDNVVDRDQAMEKLYELSQRVLKVCHDERTPLYVENNSRLDPVFQTAQEVKWLFDRLDGLAFLLDVAHMDDYAHLKQLVDIKYPDMLHVADKNLDAAHEHLPVGDGTIDFDVVFKKVLHDFEGKIVLEVPFDDTSRIVSKQNLEEILVQ